MGYSFKLLTECKTCSLSGHSQWPERVPVRAQRAKCLIAQGPAVQEVTCNAGHAQSPGGVEAPAHRQKPPLLQTSGRNAASATGGLRPSRKGEAGGGAGVNGSPFASGSQRICPILRSHNTGGRTKRFVEACRNNR